MSLNKFSRGLAKILPHDDGFFLGDLYLCGWEISTAHGTKQPHCNPQYWHPITLLCSLAFALYGDPCTSIFNAFRNKTSAAKPTLYLLLIQVPFMSHVPKRLPVFPHLHRSELSPGRQAGRCRAKGERKDYYGFRDRKLAKSQRRAGSPLFHTREVAQFSGTLLLFWLVFPTDMDSATRSQFLAGSVDNWVRRRLKFIWLDGFQASHTEFTMAVPAQVSQVLVHMHTAIRYMIIRQMCGFLLLCFGAGWH